MSFKIQYTTVTGTSGWFPAPDPGLPPLRSGHVILHEQRDGKWTPVLALEILGGEQIDRPNGGFSLRAQAPLFIGSLTTFGEKAPELSVKFGSNGFLTNFDLGEANLIDLLRNPASEARVAK